MGTTADKLNRVLATKNELKAALIEKGQDPGDVFSQYPEKIRAIQTDSIKLSSIEITKQPNKVAYTAFESFNSAGMGVEANYSNGAHKVLMPKGYTMPEGYTQVEYIESTGTQYIDSGWFPSGISYDIECGFEITGDAADQTIFGYLNKLTVNAMVGSNTFQIGMSGPWTNAESSLCAKNIFLDIVLSSVYGNQKAIINGETIYEGSVTELMILTNIGLFAWNNGGGTYLYPASGKMYRFRARENGTLVRDFVPCTNQNGEAGLFDLVNNQFYANAGSGAFITGPELPSDGYEVTDGNRLTADQNHVTISYAEYGVTKTVSQEVSVQTIAVSIPSVNESFTYTGSVLTPTWSNYDSSIISISGNTSGTNAGTYSVTFSLKDKVNYRWSDGSTSDKSVNWTINKAQASVALSKTSVVLNADKLTDTVTFSTVGMKSVIAMSSDTNVATISVSGDVITISSVNETSGAASIVLSGEVDPNYNAPEYPVVAVSAEFAFPVTVCIRSTADIVPAPYSTVKAIIGDQTVVAPSSDVFNGTVLTGTIIRLEINSMVNSTAKVEINGELVSEASITSSDVHVYEYEVEGETLIELVPARGSGTARIYNEVSTFYIDDEEYKFVGSPIWSSWLPTVWNTTGMTANGLGIYNADGSLALYTDSIVAGARYTRCTNMVSISVAGKGWQTLTNNVRATAASLSFLGATFADARECMAPSGTTIKFYSAYSYGQSGGSQGGYIYFNGDVVAGKGTGSVSYEYVLTDPIYVELKSAVTSNYGSLGCGGTVKIIEASKKRNLTITGSGNYSYCYIRVGGTKYYNPAEVDTVIGSLIECYVEDKSDGSSATIALNGSTVQSGETASYDYTVVGDTDIALSYSNKQGQIHITEK